MSDPFSEQSARLGLPYLMPAQAQKHVTHNEALAQLDLLVQLTVQAFDAVTPPSLPQDGQIWALGPAPTGDWAGQPGSLAAWVDGAWTFITPQEGWRAARVSVEGVELRLFTAGGWVVPVPDAFDNLTGLGINTAHNATNRLAVAAEATLLSHAGAGHQLKINKADAPDTASLLFQTGWSGRAEMGTAGEDDFAIKVSTDGDTWRTALRLAGASGQALFPHGAQVDGPMTGTAVTQSNTDATPGRVMRVGDFGLGFEQENSGISWFNAYHGAPQIEESDILLLCKARTPGTAFRGEIVSNRALSATTANTSGYRALLDYVVSSNGSRWPNYQLLRMHDTIRLQLVQFRMGGVDYIGLQNTSGVTGSPLRFGHIRFTGTRTDEPLAFTRVQTSELDLWDDSTDTPDGAIFDALTNGDPIVDFFNKSDAFDRSCWLFQEAEVLTRRNAVGTVSDGPTGNGNWTGSILESGANANGEYMRLANGWQICTNGNATIVTNPAAFVGTVTTLDNGKMRIGRWF